MNILVRKGKAINFNWKLWFSTFKLSKCCFRTWSLGKKCNLSSSYFLLWVIFEHSCWIGEIGIMSQNDLYCMSLLEFWCNIIKNA